MILLINVGIRERERGIWRLYPKLSYAPIYSNKSPIITIHLFMGAQLLSGRVLDSRPKGREFEPHWGHCFVVLEQDTFILA